MSILNEMTAHWRAECERFPPLLEQSSTKAAPQYAPGHWNGGIELPALPLICPFPVSFDDFLGPRHEILSGGDAGSRSGPAQAFKTAGLSPNGVRVHYGNYTIGVARYSRSEVAERIMQTILTRGWIAVCEGKVVGAYRLGHVWVHPDHRGHGLGLELGAIKWRTEPFPALYHRFNWKQRWTAAGYRLQKRLYQSLVERGVLCKP